METIVIIIIGFCVFMFSVYFTRWVFGIDKIIDLQKEQTKLLRDISKSIKNINPIKDELNKNDSKIMFDSSNCPACGNPIRKDESKCSNCGLVINEQI